MTRLTTAKDAGLIGCHDCGFVSGPYPQQIEPHNEPHCPQCGATLEFRKPDSFNRTWALLIASIIMYVPANLLPVTITTTLGKTDGQTIMEGVIYFMVAGEYPIAFVIFTASILVPTIKILIMLMLLLTAQRQSTWRPEDRTRLYQFTEFVGRWSMIDIFVIAILVALVRLGSVANIDAGVGAIYFAGVVILTMFSASYFDPRYIWDRVPPEVEFDEELM